MCTQRRCPELCHCNILHCRDDLPPAAIPTCAPQSPPMWGGYVSGRRLISPRQVPIPWSPHTWKHGVRVWVMFLGRLGWWKMLFHPKPSELERKRGNSHSLWSLSWLNQATATRRWRRSRWFLSFLHGWVWKAASKCFKVSVCSEGSCPKYLFCWELLPFNLILINN